MKAKCFFLFWGLFFVLNLIAQNSNPHVLNKTDSVRYYHYCINKAELCICDTNYSKSNKLYKKAFNYLRPFPIDLYNASLSAIYSDSFNLAIKYCKNLVRLGCDSLFFNQNPYDIIKRKKKLWNKFTDDYDIIRGEYLKTNNFKLRNTIIKLVENDQRNYCGLKELRQPEDSIFQILEEIILKHGYPDAYLIGITTDKDTFIEDYVNVLLRHYYQEYHSKLSPILFEELKKGKIKPVKFITNENFIYQPISFYGTGKFYELENGDYLYLDEFKNYTNIKKYNINRQKAMMFSYQDEIKKNIHRKNSKFRLLTTGFSKIKQNIPKNYTILKNNKEYYNFKIDYPSKKQKDSIAKYYKYINKAELRICDKQYEKALKKYITAFHFNKSPFPVDIYNTIITSIYLNDFDKAIYYSKELIKYGCTKKFFNQKVFSSLKKKKQFRTILMNDYDSLRNIYYENVNFALRNKVLDLYKQIDSLQNYRIYNKKPLKNQKEINLNIAHILLKYGYPDYKLLGVTINNDTIMRSVGGIFYNILGGVINKDNNSFLDFLKDQVYLGKLKPKAYMYLEEKKYEPLSRYEKYSVIMVKGYYYILDRSLWLGRIKKANKYRKKLFPFLETYEESVKKSIYYLKNSNLNKYLGIKSGKNKKEKRLKFILPMYVLTVDNSFDVEFEYKKVNLDDY